LSACLCSGHDDRIDLFLMHAALSRAPIEGHQFHKLFNVNVLSLLLTGAAALRFQKGLDSKKKQRQLGRTTAADRDEHSPQPEVEQELESGVAKPGGFGWKTLT
jgi:hypothetical protein